MHTFTPGALARAEQVNENFTELLNKITALEQVVNHVNDGKIVINGTLYEASGTVSTIPRFTYTYSQGGVHASTFNMPNPFTPPPGWKFFWAVDHSTGFTFISPCGHTAAHTILRVMQLGSNDSRALQKVKYWLVKA